jgi:8-oxo-dGTP pyrophosphatase MutT (NUDIX family)
MSNTIDKLAWIAIHNKQALFVRSHNKTLFYSPGGKRDLGESDQQALMREIQEELTVDLVPASISYATSIIAPADGKAADVNVKLTCYFADYVGKLTENAEIAEMKWLNYYDIEQCSAAGKKLLIWLKEQNLIE